MADEIAEHANDWACDLTRLPYPRNFVGQFSDEVLEGRPFTALEEKLVREDKLHSALDRLLLRPDFIERWFEWLDEQGLPREWRCGESRERQTQGALPIPLVNAAVKPGIESNVQHSIANNIPRKKTIKLKLYTDTCNASSTCGPDSVTVLWNKIPVADVKLKVKNSATTVTLNLRPSDILAAGTNTLDFAYLSGGKDTKAIVYVSPDDPDVFFDGSEIKKTGFFKAVWPFVGNVGSVKIALGLACLDTRDFPNQEESAKHAEDAQLLGYDRIMTPDRVNATSKGRKNVRDWLKSQSNKNLVTACTKNFERNPTGATCHVDEYPQAMFLENRAKNGVPHMRAIPGSDNTSAGSTISSYARPYLDADPMDIEIFRHTPDNFEIIVPKKGDRLYCKNAF